ncbi:MAG TPA: LysR family transcriptional regulator [Steroidobacteraceae bacterium]|jgi:DNA-binding transcriptional LysR family regulator|nr:LysR family transcriptional regulator [Steroidobacteraceae bacterium]
MRYHKLDLNLLTALKALLAEKNVTRAGEIVHVTQSAMSGILARLREYFGDPLIVQIGRRMELTPLAESLVEPVNDVLLRIDATIATRPEFNPLTTRRHFSVVASDYSINVLLLGVLRRVHHDAPGMSLEFRPPSESAPAELEAGEVDFIVNPESQNSPLQSGAILFEDSYTIVVDADNSEVGDSVGIEQYLALRHVAFKSGKHGLPQFETWMANRHGDERRVEVIAHSFYLLPHLVIGTARLATMHTRLAQQLAVGLPVRLVKPKFEIPRLIEVLQWHKYRDLDPGSMWLRDVILDGARALPPLKELEGPNVVAGV